MKNYFKFGAILIAIVAIAGIVSAAVISDTPQAGLFKSGLSSAQTLGAKCVIGPNEFKYVLNSSGTTEWQGHPVYFYWGAGNTYTVGWGSDSTSTEAFAGVVYCDAYGNMSAATGSYMWIITKGPATMYATGEGTAIAVGDVLIYDSSNTIGAGTQGTQYLKRGRAAYTATTIVTTETRAFDGYPRALQTLADGTATAISVFLK